LIFEEWEMNYLDFPKELLEETCYSEFITLIIDFASPVYKELDKLDLYMANDE